MDSKSIGIMKPNRIGKGEVHMALVQFNFKSQSVSRYVNVIVILPTDSLSFYGPAEAEARGQNPILGVQKEVYKNGIKFQTVYVYHGGGEDNSVNTRYAALERAAQDNKVMLVCPDIQFFGTDCAGGKYFTYLTEELPVVMQTLFPSSDKREDNFVMGYAMGANVALGAAIIRPELFNTCLDISGGIGLTLKTETIIDELNSEHFKTFVPSYRIAFGDSDAFKGSKYDLYPIAEKNINNGADLCNIIIACGSEEFIRARVEDDVKCLQQLKHPVEYICDEGFDHNWKMWDKYLIKGLDKLLPLKRDYLY